MDQALVAKYPFLKAGKELLKDTLPDAHSLSLAKQRVLAALAKRKLAVEGTPKERLASYALAKCMLAATRDRFAAKEWASREAQALALQLAEEDSITFESIVKELFPSLSKEESAGYAYSVAVFNYLRCGRDLVSENLWKGKIFFDREGLLHLLEEAIAARFSDIDAIDARRLPKEVLDAARDLEAKMPKTVVTGFKGSWLSLPCVQSISQGVDEGKRYYAAMALAIACFKDKLAVEQATKVMNNYAANCPKATHTFTSKEASNVLEWVYRRGGAGFSCKRMAEQGLASRELCSTCVRMPRGKRL